MSAVEMARHAARSFLAYLRVGLRSHRTYFYACIAGLATYPVELAVVYLIWSLFLTSPAGSMTREDSLVYYAITLLVARVGPSRFLSLRLEEGVMSGSLVSQRARPVVIPAAVAGQELAEVAVNLAALAPMAAVVTWLVTGRPPALAAFLLAMVVGVALQTLLRLLVGTASFWMLRITGLVHAVEFFTSLASGRILPLHVFPAWSLAALGWTPFPLLSYVPVEAMRGNLDGGALATHLLRGILWLAVLLAVFAASWRRGGPRFSAHGG